MKILYVCLNPAQHSLKRALNSFGEVYQLNWRGMDKRLLNNEIQELAPQFTHAFMQLHRGDIIDISTLVTLKDNGVKTINWTGDVRDVTPQWMIEQAKHFTVTAFNNTRDVEYMKSKGLNAMYVPMGYEDFEVVDCERDFKLTFIGSNYKDTFPLSQKRLNLINRLKKELGKDFHIFGSGWGAHTILYEQVGQTYKRSQYALNLPHYDIEGYSGNRLVNICNQGAIPVNGLDYDNAIELINDLPNLKQRPDLILSWEQTLKPLFK